MMESNWCFSRFFIVDVICPDLSTDRIPHGIIYKIIKKCFESNPNLGKVGFDLNHRVPNRDSDSALRCIICFEMPDYNQRCNRTSPKTLGAWAKQQLKAPNKNPRDGAGPSKIWMQGGIHFEEAPSNGFSLARAIWCYRTRSIPCLRLIRSSDHTHTPSTLSVLDEKFVPHTVGTCLNYSLFKRETKKGMREGLQVERVGVTDASLSLLLRQGRSHLVGPLPRRRSTRQLQSTPAVHFPLSSADKTFNFGFTA